MKIISEGTTIITTHINADFDAVASALAAQKLYPDALVVFPGSHEKTLRNFFVQSMVYHLFNIADIKDIDFSDIKRLVLVDTRQPGRVGKFSEILERSDLDIHIYDHHPPSAGDLKGHLEVTEPTGATVSILSLIIREKGIDITPDEATVMCLGIYEDTGCFTFSSTTEKDFLAAAFLLSKGANLDIIANLISREINPEQVGILNDMLRSVSRYYIKGVEIAITSISTEHYVSDFAFLTHKMMRMENLDVLFAIAHMGNKVYVVARSKTPDVDVGALVGILGGGGHAFAAAATIRDKTQAQVEHELLEVLHENIRSGRRAKDLMSSPAIRVSPDLSCEDARNLLTRYNINALLVAQKENGIDKLMGYISRQVIAKAVHLKLEHASVSEYMTTEIAVVETDAEIQEIQEKIIDNKQRVLPVMDHDDIVGVITRTDLLNVLVRQSEFRNQRLPDPFREDISARTRNIVRFVKERLSDQLVEILENVGKVANDFGFGAYAVGGFVRDLFLFRKNEDLDIVIEGDGIAFAQKYAQMHGARCHQYEKFGTAVIIFPHGFKMDVASARMEYYRFPADLPTVEMSSIKLDLFRRDFTINTLAIQLNPGKFGILIDFFSAQKDIKEKSVRILHNLSFVEDPTRVFRAIRFEQRFGFTIGKLTSGLIENAVRMDFFKQLSGRRIFTELRQILEEEYPTRAVQRLEDYDLLKFIHPALRMSRKLISAFNAVKQSLSWHDLLFLEEEYLRWIVYFAVLVSDCDRKTTEEVCDRLEIAPRHRVIFCNERFDSERCLYQIQSSVSLKNSELYKCLSGFRIEMLLYMMSVAQKEEVKKAISYYFTQLRQIKPVIRGNSLKDIGIEPGPIYGQVLNAVLDAKLNGELQTFEDELNFVRNYISPNPPSPFPERAGGEKS